MKLIDYIIIVILIVCIIVAMRSFKKRGCHHCSKCYKDCGGCKHGRKFK